MAFGGHGNLPGQFAALQGIAIDKKNRVFTSEQYMGRVQEYRYVTDAEAQLEYEKREAEKKAKEEERKGVKLEEKTPEENKAKEKPQQPAKVE